MIPYDYKKYFERDFNVAKFFGCWVNDGRAESKYYKYYFVMVNLFFIVLYNIILTIEWFANSKSVKLFAQMGYVNLICTMGQVKSTFVFIHRSDFRNLVELFNEDLFQPRNEAELTTLNHVLSVFSRFKRILISLTCVSFTSSILTPLFYSKGDGLPLEAWYPFDLSVKMNFKLAYVHQGFCITYISFINMYSDVLVSGFAHFVGLQCDLLCLRLEAIRIGDYQEQKEKLVNCVHHYRLILKFLKTTEKVFGKIYFGQLFASTTALCMDLFLLSLTEPKTFEFFYLVVYLLAVANLLLVPCWFSTEMTRKSENIPFAAYSCDWVDSSNSFKKELIFFIRRAQRPLKFYAVDFFEISVETFVKIIRTSLSYYAVLNNLNMEEKYY
ncbi:odorant receptor 4-like isoform X2 [Cylas formicarius]|uniref:odorant receptor 4-like isoform X2 n=1 Tax=Cylas formicarius TaxID=197179 RepID=UPI0029585743|nr:odorant receptor 4-like isoform X2 [Cylas formicarius]